MDISNRAKLTPTSPIRKLIPYSDQAEQQGVKIYHLNIGQPDIKTPEIFLSTLKSISQTTISYENSLGNSLLRQALSQYYQTHNISVSPNEVIITTGGSEAIFFSILAICDPGDEILVFDPCYANYLGFAAMSNVKLISVETKPETGFHLPQITDIKKQLTTKTKAIIITSPNNPTGTVFSQAELKDILKLAKSHGLYIISDETYREFVYDSKRHTSLLSIGKGRQDIILVDSLSKRYSLCGARLGCLVTHNTAVLQAVTKFAQMRLASPTIEQIAAAQTILHLNKNYLKIVKSEYQKRRDLVISMLKKIPGIQVKKPEGAFYCMPTLPVPDAEKFCVWLLTDFRYHNQTVMFAPANGFYLNQSIGQSQIRLAYVLNRSNLRRALLILKQALSVYPEKSS